VVGGVVDRSLAAACLAAVLTTSAAAQSPAPPAPAAVAPAKVAAPPPPLTMVEGEAIEHALLEASEFPFPAELEGAAKELASHDADRRAAAETALSQAAVNLAQDEHGELADPSDIDPNWALRPSYDAGADFAAARADGRVVAWVKALPRRDPAYLVLLGAARRYEAIRAHGGWKALPANLRLARGAKGGAVLALRARLAREGYGGSGGRVFDGSLAAELIEFQGRHGLKPSGVLTPETLAALNVPAAARLATIEANLERARWLPQTLPPDRIEADIAGAEATLFEDDKPVLEMRTVVGDTKHETPMFASHVSSIQFNPAWHVPADIAKAELWPKEARSPGYFASHGYSVINGQVVQHAGPKSSLGRIKFEMPNPFSVYLHDTPGHALFAVDSRGRSHGCVRLEKPKELAAALLSNQDWDINRVQETIDQGDTRWVKPSQTVAVFLVYRTAQAIDDGPAIFRPDPYGWDPKLNAALAASR
jgi:murein L,D-transpeptidase YcbB/YkuD